MGLFTPAWKGSNYVKATAQVRKFSEAMRLKKLFQVAKEAPNAAVRREATYAIRYQVTRCRNIIYDGRLDKSITVSEAETYARQGEDFLRIIAERNDEAVSLYAIAALAKYPQHKDYAFNTLNNLNNLNNWDTVDTVLGGCDHDLRIAILDRINNPETLLRLAKKNSSYEVRMLAAEKISDENILAKIASEDRDGEVRAAVFKRLSQEKIADVAIHAKDEITRGNAVEHLNDQNMLLRVVLESGDYDLRKAAIGKLKDPKILITIALETEYYKDAYEQMKKKGLLDKQTTAALRQDASEMEDMERRLRQRVKGTEAEARVLRLLDVPTWQDGSYRAYKAKRAIEELGEQLDRDTVEALTLFLYRWRDYSDIENKVTDKIFRIMQRCYMDPIFDNELLAKMRLKRFNRPRYHSDRYDSNCGSKHLDWSDPPVTFDF